MQVKIGDKLYKDSEEIVGVILTPQDRLNIIAMDPGRNFYMSYPKNTAEEQLKEFMKISQPEKPASQPAKPIAPFVPAPVSE